MKPVVFVSHSSADNDRAQALVQALEATGKLKTTFDVAHLRHGEEYAPQLYQWMARCHGAVLLLTEGVMNKPEWVLQEATILRARAVLEGPAFRLFVVIDAEALKTEVWKRWFAPLKLEALQRLKVVAPPALPAHFATAIADGMDGADSHADDFYSRLAEMIADELETVSGRSALMRTLEDGLQCDDADWTRIVGPERGVERLLARRLCRGDFGNFDDIGGLFNALQRKCPRETRRALLQLLRSFWVPLENAARLADGLNTMLGTAAADGGSGAPPNVVFIETDYPTPGRVAAMHHERQFNAYALGRWLTVAAGDEGAPALAGQVLDALRSLHPTEPAITEAALVQACDQRLRKPRSPEYTFIHVPVQAGADHVFEVARRFPPCLFVVTAPPALCRELERQLDITVARAGTHGLPQVDHLRAVDDAERYASLP
ncbi:MAG: toll/interleukin-1 receptor domain-containing protein [Rubrivivax sp.]|nr:toll/interleukin-1 receptor domain-containing protein [Rubrivivax sp.]